MDPALVAVAGALSTVATLLYRELLRRARKAEAEADYWRKKALRGTALAEIATKVAVENHDDA